MFFRILRYDLKNGCLLSLKKYIVVIFMALAFCLDYYIKLQNLAEFNNITAESSIADYFFYIFAGKDEFKPTMGQSFSFPAIWTLIFAFIMFITLIYPFKDLNEFGKYVLINTRSRKVWWYSKCCWVIVTIAIINVIFFSVIAIFGLITHASFSGEVSAYAIAISHHTYDYSWYNGFNITLELLSPFFVIVAISMLQMTVSLATKPNISFMITIAHLIASAFYCTPFLIDNYTMMLRNNNVLENGLNASTGILISVIVTVFAMISGSVMFSRYDILNKE